MVTCELQRGHAIYLSSLQFSVEVGKVTANLFNFSPNNELRFHSLPLTTPAHISDDTYGWSLLAQPVVTEKSFDCHVNCVAPALLWSVDLSVLVGRRKKTKDQTIILSHAGCARMNKREARNSL